MSFLLAPRLDRYLKVDHGHFAPCPIRHSSTMCNISQVTDSIFKQTANKQIRRFYIPILHAGKVEIVPAQAMKAYRLSSGIAPLILSLGFRGRSVIKFTSQLLYYKERTSVPTVEGATWATEPVWAVLEQNKYIVSSRT